MQPTMRVRLRAQPTKAGVPRRRDRPLLVQHDSPLRGRKLVAHRIAYEFGGFAEGKLAHDVEAMRVYGLEADAKKSGDGLIGIALGDQLHDLTFPVRKRRPIRLI